MSRNFELDDLPPSMREQAERQIRKQQPGVPGRARERRTPEADFQERVIQYARLRGWRVAHFRAARLANGEWRTPVSGDGKGWPDLALVRDDRLVFAELKSDSGTVTGEQERWLEDLELTGAETYVWRPAEEETVWVILS